MTSPLKLTPLQTRRLAIAAQRLAGPPPDPGPDGMLDVLRSIRCLQLDPIRAVERSHLLVLHSRLGDYDPADLDTLLWERGDLFEYWAHAASMVLTEDYPIFRHWMGRWGEKKDRESKWRDRARKWFEDNLSFREYIMHELHERGPLPSKDLEDRSTVAWPSSGWTSNRNVTMMLDFLWTQGHIMVAGRKGITRLWGVTTDVLADHAPRHDIDEETAVRSSIEHALRALGVATPKQIKVHFSRGAYPKINRRLKGLVADGRVHPATIEDDDGEPWPGDWYIHDDTLPQLANIQAGHWVPRTTILSPFDNLICDRDRTHLLWDFHFRIEIYVPKAKRQYGYYVLPILHGDQLIGRIDPKFDRKTNTLHVNNIYLEPATSDTPATHAALDHAITHLAKFLGAEAVERP